LLRTVVLLWIALCTPRTFCPLHSFASAARQDFVFLRFSVFALFQRFLVFISTLN
jgi:hypothetical protein